MATIESLREIIGGDADALAELERLMDENEGNLTPDLVLTTARDEDSPLHKHFEWDDTEAAIQWRKHQARHLIQSYHLHIVDAQGERRIRYYANVIVEDQNVYKRVEEVIRVDELREQRRLKLLRELTRVRGELATFEAFGPALEKVDEAIAALNQKAATAA